MRKMSFMGLAGAVAVAALVATVSVARTSRSGTATGTASCHVVAQSNAPIGTVVACPAGEYLTGGGGGCYGGAAGWDSWLVSSRASGNGWAVSCENIKTGDKQLSGYTEAICCKP
jgi:hypothetical protein